MALKKIRHKGLQELWETGRTARINKGLHRNALAIMDYLHRVRNLRQCIGVKNFHGLSGNRKGEYTMHVTGNWCITFEFDGNDVTILDLEDYH